MHEKLQVYAREEIKKGLSLCTNDQQLFFKRVYSHDNLNVDINYIVDNLQKEQLSIVLWQVERTLSKNNLDK